MRKNLMSAFTVNCIFVMSVAITACSKSTSQPVPGSEQAAASLSGDGSSILTLDFGDSSVSSSSEKTITINNPTSDAFTNLQVSLSNQKFQFKGGAYPGAGGTCASSLAPNSSCTVVVMPKTNQGAGIVSRDAIGTLTGSLEATLNIVFMQNGVLKSNVITLKVIGANSAPVAVAQSVSVDEDTSRAILLAGSDGDSDPLTFMVVSQPSHGVLSGVIPQLIYTPVSNFSGADSFTFKTNDGSVDSEVVTVSITVNEVNDTPVANGQIVSTNEDSAKIITLVGSDIENSPLTFSIVADPTHGTLSASGASRTYTPSANYFGSDSFTFRVDDGQLNSNVATVSITVVPVNDPPIAQTGSLIVSKNTPKVGMLMGSDIDTESFSFTYSIVAQGNSGNAVIANPSTGVFTYTPNTNAAGVDSFSFKVNDGSLDSTTATISVCIAGDSGSADLCLGGTGSINTGIFSIIGNGGGYVGLKANGNILVAGSGRLAEFLPNGAVNQAFGVNGIVDPLANPNPLRGDAVHLTVGASQKIFIAATGGVGTPAAISSYDAAGVINTSYISSNYPHLFGAPSFISTDSSGRILLFGGNTLEGISYAIVRLNDSGGPDDTFANGGVLTSVLGGSAYEAVLNSDGSMVVAARGGLAKLNAAGALDTSFGTNGIVNVSTLGISGTPFVASVTKTNDGGYVFLGGNAYNSSYPTQKVVLAKVNSSGALDSSFGTSGLKVIVQGYGNSSTGRVRALPDGNLVVVGYYECLGGSNGTSAGDSACNTTRQSGSTLMKFTGSGADVTGFGVGGKVTLPFYQQSNPWPWAPVLELQQDGRILTTTYNNGIFLRRFWP